MNLTLGGQKKINHYVKKTCLFDPGHAHNGLFTGCAALVPQAAG